MPRILEQYHRADMWRGAGFPIARAGSKTPVVIQQDMDEVYSSIIQILNTQRGERVMYPTFGSSLRALLWEPNDSVLRQQVQFEVTRTLGQWEPRIIVDGIQFDDNPNYRNRGIITILVTVRLRNNPRQQTIVRVPISSQGELWK